MDIFNFAENKDVTQCPNQMVMINDGTYLLAKHQIIGSDL